MTRGTLRWITCRALPGLLLARLLLVGLLLAGSLLAGGRAVGGEEADEQPDRTLRLAGGRITLEAPEAWQPKDPATRIVDFEFAAPADDEELADGRVTVMGAGGSVKQNIERWFSQFTQRTESEVEELKIADQTVHLVDISGAYKDQRGPFAPATIREDYRMLAAIIVTDELGQYFIKMYGPAATIEKHQKDFHQMVRSLKVP